MSGSDSPTFFHGQPWSSWIERIGRDKPLSDEEPEAEPASSVTRLSADDIDLYGFCPERDTFYGVVCEICNAIVKPQALIQHMESRHSSGTVNLPPPSTPASKTPVKTPYCKVSKLTKKGQPTTPSSAGTAAGGGTSSNTSNSKINHSSVKRNAEQANLQQPALANASPRSPLEPIGISGNSSVSGVPSSPVKSPGSNGNSNSSNNGAANSIGTTSASATGPGQRRKRLKADRGLVKDREYDPDRHCGVWIEDSGKTCTRSLTCKAHTVSLRRTVIGRSKSFDKLLADHRASKELPNRTPKVTVTGTVTVSTASVSALTGSSGVTAGVGAVGTTTDTDAPGSPPVLSLPDTYPLPKAVDLLYRCLAPHGSTKPTKLEEDFANEELRLEASRSAAATAATASSSPSTAPSSASTTSKSMLPPISVVLPSLSPIANDTPQHIATLIPVTSSLSSVVSASLAAPQAQLPSTVLEGETTGDDESESMTLYSPVSIFKDTKSQVVMQVPRSNNTITANNSISNSNSLLQSPVQHQSSAATASSSRNSYQGSSMPSLAFDDQLEHPKLANGKRLNNNSNINTNHNNSLLLSPIGSSSSSSRSSKRSKHDYQAEFPRAIQVEATTTSTPFSSHFSDIAWSNCHPEPLAVSRWLRITSSRKQYNFNIH
ncbi:ataxin-7-like protein 1 isoform X1 [Microplitis demolitor]|uniref:ataxin-7-like protein 1 isoform X1 n=1 Tax=Microplitis demolitor TaxID=69319 RepID=UPI0004CCD2A8|nr:ataxin-7-like protein 1 isoform X1 [Microplitis demolitor]